MIRNTTGLGNDVVKRAQRDYARFHKITVPAGHEIEKTKFGLPAQELQRRIRRDAHLPIDGDLSRRDLAVLGPFFPRPLSTGRTPGALALSWAGGQIGPMETYGMNDGPLIRIISHELDVDWMWKQNLAYCALGTWGSVHFGAEINLAKLFPGVSFVSCPSWSAAVREERESVDGKWRWRWVRSVSGIRPGYFLFFDWQRNGVADHTGFATTGFHAGGVRTLEFNTPPSDDGDQSGLGSGDGCWPKWRSESTIHTIGELQKVA